jgi:leukotriene-A4 hydrolase
VLFLWLRLAVRNEFKPAYPGLEAFLTSQGRLKFVEPLFKALVDTPGGRTEARRIYGRARTLYHTSARQALDVLVDPASRR